MLKPVNWTGIDTAQWAIDLEGDAFVAPEFARYLLSVIVHMNEVFNDIMQKIDTDRALMGIELDTIVAGLPEDDPIVEAVNRGHEMWPPEEAK